MKNNCIYFVEGQCEEVLLNALKERPPKIVPGRVKVFNVIKNELTRSQLLMIQPGTTVVLVFDTDVAITDKLRRNIRLIDQYCSRTKIVFLPQVLNLEDELVRCTDVRSPAELTRSKSVKDFKRDFCAFSQRVEMIEILDLLSFYAQQYRGTTKRGIEALSWKMQGMSISEIAEALKIPPSYVGAWISKAKFALRRDPGFRQTIL